MPLDKIGKQLMLKGMRALRGAERVEGKPGLWRIEPEKLSENKWLTRANKRMLDEGDLAEFNGNLNGLRSISGKERAKHAYMTSGALNTLRTNSEPWSRDDAVRGLVQVDKNGNVIGATAVDQRKGAELLGDLDMTRQPPGYLEYIGTVAPEARGLDLMQQTQDWLGNDLLFQAASPKKNVPLYQSWGARLAPEIEGGVPELPYMRLMQRAERQAEENPKQLRLEGFAGGGKVVDLITKPVRDFSKSLREAALERSAQIAEQVNAYDGWKYGVGDRIRSPSGQLLEIKGRSWVDRGPKQGPRYKVERIDVSPETDGWWKGDALPDILHKDEYQNLTGAPLELIKKAGGGLVALRSAR